MPRTLSLLAVLKKIDAKGVKSLSNAQWDTFLASDTEPNEIQEKIKKLEGYVEKGAAYDKTGQLIPEDNQAMIDRFRARTGRGVGRESLKVKKSKIDVKSFKEDFLNKKKEVGKEDIVETSISTFKPPALPPDLSSPEEEDKKEETQGLKGIRDILDEILKVLRLDFKGDRKEARDARKADAKEKREKREAKLEGGLKKSLGLIGKSVKAMLSPFSKIWDAIIKFLKFTLIGVLFNKTLKWFEDPRNKKKAERVGKFFKDWWPTLATAAVLWLTPLGALLAGMTSLLTAIIPKLVLAIATNPYAALALVGTGVTIWGVHKLAGMSSRPNEDIDQSVREIGIEETLNQLREEEETIGVMGRVSEFFSGRGLERQRQIERLEEVLNTEGSSDGGMEGNLSDGFSDVRAEQNMGTFTGDGFMKEFEGTAGFQEFNQGGLVQHYNDQKSAQNFVQKYNEGGLVQNFNEGGLVQKYNQGGLVQKYNEGGLVQKYNQGGLVQNFNEGGLVNNLTQIKNYKEGGQVRGPGGVDKVPAKLTAGEFVMSKGAVQKFGVNTLASMNASGGATNVPTITQDRREYNEGGVVQYFESGGIVMNNVMRKEPVGTPIVQSTHRTITLPTIPKQQMGAQTKSQSDIPNFRIPIISPQRSMVLASLGIEDLIGE